MRQAGGVLPVRRSGRERRAYPTMAGRRAVRLSSVRPAGAGRRKPVRHVRHHGEAAEEVRPRQKTDAGRP